MTDRVEVDWPALSRGLTKLTTGLARVTQPTATREAAQVASKLRNLTPVRTGRLAATIRTSSDRDGAAVHYGGTLPYAGYIAKRTGSVEQATAGADQSFADAMRAAGTAVARTL